MITTSRLAKERNRKAGRKFLKVTALFVLVVFSSPQITWAGEAASVVPPGSLDGVPSLGGPVIDPPSGPSFSAPLPDSAGGQRNPTSTEFLLGENQPLSPVTEAMIEIPQPVKSKPSPLGGFTISATSVKEKKDEKDYSGPGITTGNLKDVIPQDIKPVGSPKIEKVNDEPIKINGEPLVKTAPRENLVSRIERNHFLRNAVVSFISSKETKRKRKAQRGRRGATLAFSRKAN